MKILHVIPSLAAVRGGPGQAALELVKALRACNVEAEIAATNDNGPGLLDVPLCRKSDYQGAPVWFFPRFSPAVSYLREYAFSALFSRWLLRGISGYDLLHVHGIFSYTCSMAMLMARLKKVPYLVRPNGMLCAWSLKQGRLKKQIYLDLFERANLDRAGALEFTSSQEHEEARVLNLRPQSFILPYGLTPSMPLADAPLRLKQFLKIPGNEPVILFMSRLHHKKGLEYLIPALGRLKERPFRFIIAGSGSKKYEAKIKRLLEKEGIYSRTHILGYVQGEAKQLLLQGADLFALTSHSESFGLAVLEALAAGLPVLLTPGVPLASLIKKEGLGFVAEMEVGEIADTIKRCLDNPQGLKEMGGRGREVVRREYNWEAIAGKLSRIYAAVLNREDLPQ
ncbi:MAG: glycosyltransferase [Candidatus Omnitrophota bacterium]|jgi:glycosyltransferase involved in cell wall biosynthesis